MTLEEFNGERGKHIATVARKYEEITNNLISRSAIEDIGFYLDRGLEPDLMIKAIETTAERGLRWNYTNGILKRCLEEDILTAKDWEFNVLFKKGIAEAVKNNINANDDFELSVYLAATVFKEYIEETQRDLERYLKACESGDTSEWDKRWRKFGIVNIGAI